MLPEINLKPFKIPNQAKNKIKRKKIRSGRVERSRNGMSDGRYFFTLGLEGSGSKLTSTSDHWNLVIPNTTSLRFYRNAITNSGLKFSNYI